MAERMSGFDTEASEQDRGAGEAASAVAALGAPPVAEPVSRGGVQLHSQVVARLPEGARAEFFRRLARQRGNRYASAVASASARTLARQPAAATSSAAAAAELTSDSQATQYAGTLVGSASKRSLTEPTRRLFRHLVRSHAPEIWARLGSEWTFDDYPFQTFTFEVMRTRPGMAPHLGIGPAFIQRMAAGEETALTAELRVAVGELLTGAERAAALAAQGPPLRTIARIWPELEAAIGAVQASAQPATRDPGVPGLGAERAKRTQFLVDKGYRDLAVAYFVHCKISDGGIKAALLEGETMLYDPDLSEDGICSMHRWDYAANKAEPTRVRIGKGAVSSVPYLYSVAMHEYQHVLQRQTLANQDRDRRLREQGFKSGNEVEAYAWELLHADESGLKALPEKIATMWRLLNEEFWVLDAGEQARVRPIATRARARAQAMVARTTVTLEPFRRP